MKTGDLSVVPAELVPHGPFDIEALRGSDLELVARLHAGAFGPGRFARTAYRIREGAPPFSVHCRAAWSADNTKRLFAGSVTLTEITVGDGAGHWLLGPLVVHASAIKQGIGRRLVEASLASITALAGNAAVVILVGDLNYYARFGFEVVPRGQITLPGPVDPARLLIWRGRDGTRTIPTGAVRSV